MFPNLFLTNMEWKWHRMTPKKKDVFFVVLWKQGDEKFHEFGAGAIITSLAMHGDMPIILQ